MIVKISGIGKSFKGLAAYLTHDPNNAKTTERVAWTHTINLANDDVPSAVNEMYLTAENAELLKMKAGIAAGGRKTKSSVKHISLNWAPDEEPTREHMIETACGFLRFMGWEERQAILVAHTDKQPHVHIMLNRVHPENGLRLNESFEQRRAQAWALAYEQQYGLHCKQRLKNERDREDNMPRNIWKAMKAKEQEFNRAEEKLAEQSEDIQSPQDAEWKILKEIQRSERIDYFTQGKIEFTALRNSVYREVRETFRPRWAEFYAFKKSSNDEKMIAEMKAQLTADQLFMLESKRNAACQDLLDARQGRYRELADYQKEARAELKWRQEVGLDPTLFLSELEKRRTSLQNPPPGFRRAALEVTRRQEAVAQTTENEDRAERRDRDFSSNDVRFDPVERIGGGIVALGDALVFHLFNLGSAKPEPMSAAERADLFREAAENVTKQLQHDRDEEDEQRDARQRAIGE